MFHRVRVLHSLGFTVQVLESSILGYTTVYHQQRGGNGSLWLLRAACVFWTTMPHIFIVEDEVNVASALTLMLHSNGFTTTIAATGRRALDILSTAAPFDLALLDLQLGDPLCNGLVVCQAIRRRPTYLPVIMLTVHDSPDDKVLGLDVGADDYITKPYHERELLARIRAALRANALRAPATPAPALVIDDYLQIDPHARTVFCAGQRIDLSRRQYDLLLYLVLHAGQPWGRQTLLDRVWGEDFIGTDRTVDKHIAELRQKLEPNPAEPCYVLTEHGFGYRFRSW
jgi:DNA-binding response OmpR family regulator